MKVIKLLYITAIILGVVSTSAIATTTNNLTTPLNTWTYSGGSTALDSNTGVFNWQGGTITSPNINLNNTLSQSEINKGFTSTYGLDILFWCNNHIGGYCENSAGFARDTVIMTQKLTGSDGTIITQNRTITQGYNPDFVNYQDILIVNPNSLTNYTVNLSIFGIDNGFWWGFYGPIVSNPTLTIDYTKDIVLPANTTTQLQAAETNLITSQQTIQNTTNTLPPPNTLENTLSIDENKLPTTNTTSLSTNTISNDPIKSESSITSSMTNTMTSEEPKTSTKESNVNTTSTTQETATTSKTTDTKTESNKENKSSTTTQSTSSENTKTEGSKTQTTNEKSLSTKENVVDAKGVSPIDIKIKAAIEKVERELKSIDEKTKAIQEIKLEGLKAGAPNLSAYENRAFYEPKYYNGVPNPDFYTQADISQKAVYTNVNLNAYVNKDPIAKQQIAMAEIQDEMNEIIMQLEELKRNR